MINIRDKKGIRMKNNFRIGICQMKVVDDKKSNLDKATDMIEEAAKKGQK